MENKKTKWTIAIIAQYDENDSLVKAAYGELVEAICKYAGGKNINYIIFRYNNNNTAFIEQPEEKDGKIFMKSSDLITGVNFYDGKELEKFMSNYVKRPPANDQGYILMTWGHGTGFGFFPQRHEGGDGTIAESIMSLSVNEKGLLSFSKTNSFLKAQFPVEDDNTGAGLEMFNETEIGDAVVLEAQQIEVSVLKLQTLKNIISETIGKADVLITMNCYMQMFETGLYLADVADIMISPQTKISFWGFNYKKLFELLKNQDGITSDDIGRNVCMYFTQKYFEEPLRSMLDERAEPVIFPDIVAFSANRLKLYSSIRDELRKIIITLNERIKNKEKIKLTINGAVALVDCITKNARSRCSELANGELIFGVVDIKTFLDNVGLEIAPDIFDSTLQDVFREFNERRAEAIVASHWPGNLFGPEVVTNRFPLKGPQGISIFFPNGSKAQTDFRLNSGVDYGKMIDIPEWNEFLDNIAIHNGHC